MNLSPRQYQMAMLAAQGCTDREIADRLALSYGTVREHMTQARKKLGVRSRLDMALMYVRGELRRGAA